MREDITGRKSGFFYRELHDKSLRIGAQEKTRTSTTIQLPAPEAGASTNSATWAYATVYYYLTMFGAQEKTRTSTTLQSLAPEASASTNSATWASSNFAELTF